MNRRAVMDYLRMRDGRNPYGSRGGYVDTQRGGRGGGDYARNDYNYSNRQYDSRRGDMAYSQQDNERGGRDYEYSRQYDMGTRYPFNVAGEFSRYDSRSDMHHYNPNYGYPMPMMYDRNYGRGDYTGDYGETLNHKELEHWNKKLMKEVEDKDKQFFSKESIARKAQQMGINFDKYSEEELAVATAMMYTDYNKALKPFVGANMDVYVKLADAFIVEDKEEDD